MARLPSRPMPLRRAPVALGLAWSGTLAVLALGGCAQPEASRLNDDVQHTLDPARSRAEWRRLRRDVQLYVVENHLLVNEVALDAEHFLEWRRNEWWVLQDELAWHLAYDLDRMEVLTTQAAKFYGYEVRQFPRIPKDAMEFFRKADPEWRALVQDAAIFIEHEQRQVMPLRRELREFYDRMYWEAARLPVEIDRFLEFRRRELDPLRQDTREFIAAAGPELDAFIRDVDLMRARAAVEHRYLIADLAKFGHEEAQQPPKLVDDVSKFMRFRDREWDPLRREVRDFVARGQWESDRLYLDVVRLTEPERQRIPRLLDDLQEVWARHRWEADRLGAETRRFIAQEVAIGHRLPRDVDEVLRKAPEEAADLVVEVDRSVAYADKEWADFKRTVREIATYEKGPFGADPTAPARDSNLMLQQRTVPRRYDGRD